MKKRIGVGKEKDKYLIDISDDDILTAMKEIDGYLDISFGDFKELYHIACSHALKRLMQSVKARDIMTKKVVCVYKQTSSREVAEVMAKNSVSGIPVIDDGEQVVGIISENDFLSRMGKKEIKSFMNIIALCLEDKGCVAMPIRNQNAEDIMTSPAITANEDTPVSDIVNLFAQKKINRVPVLSQDKKLVGIVSRGNVLQTVIPRIRG
ncbi:MAG: CBS domain-containing protein [Deltaproteobacteria bacterium]|jgi:CBS domain-containing membrane protein|nr:CBS domain-containing protein [Deltaproteobacteria bacterium]